MALFTFLFEIWRLCPHFSCKRKVLRNKNKIKTFVAFTAPCFFRRPSGNFLPPKNKLI
jgi:hypothetical protein